MTNTDYRGELNFDSDRPSSGVASFHPCSGWQPGYSSADAASLAEVPGDKPPAAYGRMFGAALSVAFIVIWTSQLFGVGAAAKCSDGQFSYMDNYGTCVARGGVAISYR